MAKSDTFFELVKHPLKFRLFLLYKLPSAFFSGLRVRLVDQEKCVVTVPYKWFSTNPFRSTYFACLSMAAEMSTGVLAMGQIYKQNPQVSMLVLKVEGDFKKKATGLTTFICTDGLAVKALVQEALTSDKAVTGVMRSIGKNNEGATVAEFAITWSFKRKGK